jgi:hypothetical protein
MVGNRHLGDNLGTGNRKPRGHPKSNQRQTNAYADQEESRTKCTEQYGDANLLGLTNLSGEQQVATVQRPAYWINQGNLELPGASPANVPYVGSLCQTGPLNKDCW